MANNELDEPFEDDEAPEEQEDYSAEYILLCTSAPHVTSARLRDSRGALPSGLRVELKLLTSRPIPFTNRVSYVFSCTYRNAPGSTIHFRAHDTELYDFTLPPHLKKG